MRLVFSAGGTGGHIFPALAVADEIKRREPTADILFIGAKGKMEMERVPKAGYPIKGLWISGFLGKSIFSKMMTGVKLVHSLLTSYFILRKHKPQMAIGFGGFASGAALMAASRMGIKTMIQEQNSYPGLTNRLLGKRVDMICATYEEVKTYLPADKVEILGNPVRGSLAADINKSDAYRHYNLDETKKTVLIVGGSLGARTFNKAMRSLTDEIRDHDAQYIWQAGQLYIDEYGKCDTALLENVRCLAFLERMDMAYAVADVVIGRAGALTVSELALLGKASLLVPSPNVSEDHQTKNAMALVDKGAAEILKDVDCEKNMIKRVKAMMEDEEKLRRLKQNIQAFAKPNATERIADLVLEMLNK